MRLAVILVILAFCYCGSYATPNGCSCRQPGEMDSEYPGDMNYNQLRIRRDEQVQQSLEDPSGTQDENRIRHPRKFSVGFASGYRKNLRANKTMGYATLTPSRLRRTFPKPDMVRLLREYAQEPEYVDGWTSGDYTA